VLPDAIDPPSDEDLKAEYVKALDEGNKRMRKGTGGLMVSSSLGATIPSSRAYGGKRFWSR
jgi:hypothetical protein